MSANNDFDFNAELDVMHKHYTTKPHFSNYYTKSKSFHKVLNSKGFGSVQSKDSQPNQTPTNKAPQGTTMPPADTESAVKTFADGIIHFVYEQAEELGMAIGKYKTALDKAKTEDEKQKAKQALTDALEADEQKAKAASDDLIQAFYSDLRKLGEGKSADVQMALAKWAVKASSVFTSAVLSKLMDLFGKINKDLNEDSIDQIQSEIKKASENITKNISNSLMSAY